MKKYQYCGAQTLPENNGVLLKFANGSEKETAYFQVSTDFAVKNELFLKENDAHQSIKRILKEYPLQIDKISAEYFLANRDLFFDCLDICEEQCRAVADSASSKKQEVFNLCAKMTKDL